MKCVPDDPRTAGVPIPATPEPPACPSLPPPICTYICILHRTHPAQCQMKYGVLVAPSKCEVVVGEVMYQDSDPDPPAASAKAKDPDSHSGDYAMVAPKIQRTASQISHAVRITVWRACCMAC